MRLSAEEMTVWVKNFYARAGKPFQKDVVWTQVARDAKFTKDRIFVQRAREDIDALAIINVARTHGKNPLEELARIPRWLILASMPSTPSAREILSSMHPRHTFTELGRRLGNATPSRIDLEPWDSYHGRFSTWFDVTGGEAAKSRLKEAINLTSASAMSARLNSHTKFEVDDILDGFIPAGQDPVFALVLAGWITDAEAGYALTLRQQTLVSTSNDELIYMMNKQMRFTTQMLVGKRSPASLTK